MDLEKLERAKIIQKEITSLEYDLRNWSMVESCKTALCTDANGIEKRCKIYLRSEDLILFNQAIIAKKIELLNEELEKL